MHKEELKNLFIEIENCKCVICNEKCSTQQALSNHILSKDHKIHLINKLDSLSDDEEKLPAIIKNNRVPTLKPPQKFQQNSSKISNEG